LEETQVIQNLLSKEEEALTTEYLLADFQDDISTPTHFKIFYIFL
jgi:hypothetical protein